jgi:hypothetical protein
MRRASSAGRNAEARLTSRRTDSSSEGRRSSWGSDLEGLEGFARTFPLAAFRLRGSDGAVPRLGAVFARGPSVGCDPSQR